MSNFKKILSYLSSLFLWLFIFLNMFSKQTYSLENIYHLVGVTFKSNPLLTILLFILISLGILIWGKIFVNVINWLKKHNPITHTLSKYESYYIRGEYDNALLALKAKSIWNLFPSYKYFIHKLASKVYLIQGKEKLCSKNIKSALKFVRSKENEIEIKEIEIQLYISAGSINLANDLILDIKNKLSQSSYQTLSHFEALILEKKGLLEESISKLVSASQPIEKNNSQELFSIYNNLGRISGLLKDNTHEIIFYEKAKALTTSKSSRYQHHIIYQNLIGYFLRFGNQDKFSSLFNEYSSFIDKQNKYDLLEFYNFLLRLYRQTMDLPAFNNVIELMHKNLYPILTKDEQLISSITELSLCFNNIGINLDLLQKINVDFSSYSKFNLQEKLLAYQIIFQAITSPDGTQCLHPFEEMHKYIFNFLRNSLSQIDSFIENELEDFQIYAISWMLDKKVWLINFQPHNSDNIYTLIKQKLNIKGDITTAYARSGDIISTLESKLDYVDECMGSLQNQLTSEQNQFLKEEMLSSFEKVESEIQTYLNHPAMPPLLIRLAKYSSFFNNLELTKKYYCAFRELNLSINHFAAWIQTYYRDVETYLNQNQI